MVKLLDRVKMTVTGAPGTGNITLNAAEAGFQTFAQAGAVDTNVVRYAVTDGTNFEIGTAVLSSSASVLTRTVQQSSNSNNALDLTSSAIVFATLSAADLSGNAAPIFTTTPPTTLNLNNSGSTAVTLTGQAYDESGAPVSYDWDGWATGGTSIYTSSSLPPQLASAPTINQSTGVYSLVGSGTASNSGNFNFRVKASDGVKIATNVTDVSLRFIPVTSGLLGLYDVANVNSYSGSGTTWSDISGNSGPDITLDSSTTYNSSGIGGLPTLNYGNALNSFATTSNLGSSSTVVLILQFDAFSSGDQVVFLGPATGSDSAVGFYHILDNTQSLTALNGTAANRMSSASSTTANTLIVDKEDRSTILRKDMADLLYGAATQIGQLHSISLSTADLSNGFSAQYRYYGSTTHITNGQIRAICFYNRTLSATEVGQIHDYFKADYPSDSHMPA